MTYDEMASDLRIAIKALHARKANAYGSAWKRRGERISIVPNIARKVDRLTVFASNKSILRDEHILDTAVDLYVYCVKYLLYLAERVPEVVPTLPLHEPCLPLSDRNENFDQLVDAANLQSNERTLEELIASISELFDHLCLVVENQPNSKTRIAIARKLGEAASVLIAVIGREHPNAAHAFARRELQSHKHREP
jgi:hypothetical protein